MSIIPLRLVRLRSAAGVFWPVMIVFLIVPNFAGAALLGTHANTASLAFQGISTGIDVPLSYGGSVSLGENISLFNSFAPVLISYTSNADDPEYSAFVALLTNGNNDQLSDSMLLHGTNVGPTTLYSESAAFGGLPDFAGYHIDEIRLTVDPFVMYITPPSAQLPNGLTAVLTPPPNSSPVLSYHWDILGTAVPEPRSIVLLGLGALAIAFRRCRR